MLALTKGITMFRSDEGLTLETSAFQSLYGGQFTLSTLLINQIYVFKIADFHWLFTTVDYQQIVYE